MSHWAKVVDGIVEQVVAIDNQDVSDEDAGQLLSSIDGGVWIQTSYNTFGGKHTLGGQPVRKNYAGIGYTYDEQLDAFISPKPDGDGWQLNQDSCLWENPSLGILNVWDDQLNRWVIKASTTPSNV